ncbi:MAG: hypothetical protein NTX61_06610 [Bacteroidetes bacterium]|nr:hypothetical protein [Bacteroidota bacterium]
MIQNIKPKDIFEAVILKAGMKQDVYKNTVNGFNDFKSEVNRLAITFQNTAKPGKWNIPFEYKDRGQFEFELKFGGDVLIFFMHSNVFEIPRDHDVMKTSYIKENKTRSYCGIIYIFNFLADSFKYSRINDIGYLIGRVFINRENHYFIEGKREIGLLYNNFATSKLTRQSVLSIITSSISYTLNFDLLTPPYENMKEVTVEEMQTTLDNILIKTGKRLGYKFQADILDEAT